MDDLKSADNTYNSKRVDKEKSKSDSSVTCLTFDLQQY